MGIPAIDPNPVDLPETVAPFLAMLRNDAIEQAAAFRVLRRRLVEQCDPHAILVTSAQDEEGKSICAANLALAIAESGRVKVLLVEASLRRPSLAQIFGFQPLACLIQQLATHREQAHAPWRTTEIRSTGLHVLAVATDSPGDQLLHGPTFAAAVAGWCLAFDYVVIDGPSVLSSCEASIIHDSADAVVMVVRSGSTRNRVLRRALEQMSAEKVAGIVLMPGSS